MDPITAFQGLLSFLGINAGGAAATTGATTTLAPAAGSGLGLTAGAGGTGLQAAGGLGLTGAPATAAAAAQPAMTDIAIKMGGLEGLKKAGSSLLDPNMSLHDKFNTVAPEAYKQSMSSQSDFAKLQQGAQPMQMPSYAQPSMPYQGGGIEEILKRQQGLLR